MRGGFPRMLEPSAGFPWARIRPKAGAHKKIERGRDHEKEDGMFTGLDGAAECADRLRRRLSGGCLRHVAAGDPDDPGGNGVPEWPGGGRHLHERIPECRLPARRRVDLSHGRGDRPAQRRDWGVPYRRGAQRDVLQRENRPGYVRCLCRRHGHHQCDL